MHDARQIIHVFDEIIMLGACACDADRVGLLKRIGADEMGRHLAGNAYHGNGIHQRIGQAGHRIGRAGAGGDKHNAAFTAGTGIALSRMGRALFMADKNMLNILLLEQFVINRQYGAAGIAEYMLNTLILQRLQDNLRLSASRSSHFLILSCRLSLNDRYL